MAVKQQRASERILLLSGTVYVESRVLDGYVKLKRVDVEQKSDEGSHDRNKPALVCLSLHSPGRDGLEVDRSSVGHYHHKSSASSSHKRFWLDPSTVNVLLDEGHSLRCEFHVQESGGVLSHVVSGSHHRDVGTVQLYPLTITLSGDDTLWKTNTLKLCFKSLDSLREWKRVLTESLHVLDDGHRDMERVSLRSPPVTNENLWDTFLHVNGISIYTENESRMHGGSSANSGIMSSVVIRSSPKSCLKSILSGGLQESRVGGTLAFSDSVDVLKHLDNFSSIVRITWSCSNVLGYIFSPREAVLLRTWRRDEEGTYVIVYQAATEYAIENRSGNGSVQAHSIAAGFTIAPLRQEYAQQDVYDPAESPESLVTLVVKADLGGFMANSGIMSRFMPRAHAYLRMRLTQPLIMSLILLRDRLEQSRFVVMPSMYSRDEEQDDLMIDDHLRHSWIDVSESSAAIAKRPSLVGHTAEPEAFSIFGKEGSCDKRFWSYPGYDYLKLRGKNYLQDKVKVPARAPVFELYSSDLIDSDHVLFHVAENLPSVQFCDAPFAFVLNLVFPNSPLQSLVTVWTCPFDPTEYTVDELVSKWEDRDEDTSDGSLAAFFKNFKDWIDGDDPLDDERRNKKFKLIPRIAKGSWVVRQSVGTTPVLLGQKLSSKYFRGRTSRGCSYFEMDVDITSNAVANNVTRLVVNSITSLVVDLAPLIEGQSPDELPERLIGCVRYNHLDLRTAAKWDPQNNSIMKNS
jgi:hypothetical protein